MAFTIPNSIQKSENACGFVEKTAWDSREGEDGIAFHKHCQRTVLSAYSGGAGATWLAIESLNLSNLPLGWIDYFKHTGDSENNITYDFAAILKILNDVAASGKTFNIQFNDNHDRKIAGPTVITLGNPTLYAFSGFGKDITFKLDDGRQFVSFQSIGGDTSYVVAIPTGTVQFQKNGEDFGDPITVYSPDTSQTVDIEDDCNKLPTNGYSAYLEMYGGGLINGKQFVFRHHQNGGWVTPTFVIDGKYVQMNQSDAPVVEWEFHIKNIHSSSRITVNNPIVKVGVDLDPNWFKSVVQLTDQMYVEPGKTNVYVFRADMYDFSEIGLQKIRALTYSLAYVY